MLWDEDANVALLNVQPFRLLRRGAFVAAVFAAAAGPAAGDARVADFEAFCDRWVDATRSGDGRALQGLFQESARLDFNSEGRNRVVEIGDYTDILREAHSSLKSLGRKRGPLEITPEEGSQGALVVFEVTDRIETPEGFVVESVSREEFEFGPGDSQRALRYHSRLLSWETLRTPEDWMKYGGPKGLNGFLIDAHFRSAPKGMGFWVAGAVAILVILLKTIHSLGMRKRF